MDSEIFPKGVVVIQLPQYVDVRGCLSVLNAQGDLPFEVKRTFWIFDVPASQVRGGHAHWTCHEAVFALSGSFVLDVDDGQVQHSFVLDDPSVGVVIPAGVWCELRNFSAGTICLAVASEPYEERGYVSDKSLWLHQVNNISNASKQ